MHSLLFVSCLLNPFFVKKNNTNPAIMTSFWQAFSQKENRSIDDQFQTFFVQYAEFPYDIEFIAPQKARNSWHDNLFEH